VAPKVKRVKKSRARIRIGGLDKTGKIYYNKSRKSMEMEGEKT